MQELCTSVIILGSFALIGKDTLRFILRNGELSNEFSLVVGLLVATTLCSFGYQFGLRVESIGFSIYALSICMGAVSLIRVIKKGFVTGIPWLKMTLSCVPYAVFVVIVELPLRVGGYNFKVFQGNHWDQLSYIGISQSLSRYRFNDLASGYEMNLHLQDPVSIIATNSLRSRPNVELLYTTMASPLNVSIIDFAYSFQLVLLAVSLFTIVGFVKYFIDIELTVSRIFAVKMLSVAFVCGFWGQYFVDLNAWSALSVVPIIMFLFVICDKWSKRIDIATGCILISAIVSLTLLYPEAMIFITPFLLLFFYLRMQQLRKVNLEGVFKSSVIVVLSFAILAISYYKPLQFGIEQLKFGNSTSSENWGSYFQAFFAGQDGRLGARSGLFLYSVPMALSGMYFLAPQSLGATSIPNALLSSLVLIACISLVLLTIITFIKKRKKAIYVAFLPAAVIVPIVKMSSTVWVAGKAVNYLIPVLFALLVMMILEFKCELRSIKNIGIIALTTVWAMSQFVFAVNRIQTVQEFGIPHKPPYISIQDNSLKMNQDWFISKAQFKECSVVELRIEEPFQRFFAQMKLNEFEILWYDVLPINTYFGAGSDLGQMKKLINEESCLLTNEGDTKKRFSVS